MKRYDVTPDAASTKSIPPRHFRCSLAFLRGIRVFSMDTICRTHRNFSARGRRPVGDSSFHDSLQPGRSSLKTDCDLGRLVVRLVSSIYLLFPYSRSASFHDESHLSVTMMLCRLVARSWRDVAPAHRNSERRLHTEWRDGQVWLEHTRRSRLVSVAQSGIPTAVHFQPSSLT